MNLMLSKLICSALLSDEHCACESVSSQQISKVISESVVLPRHAFQ